MIFVIKIENASVTLIYVDATKGWLSTASGESILDLTQQPLYVTATGGTITTCGDYKIHTLQALEHFVFTCAW